MTMGVFAPESGLDNRAAVFQDEILWTSYNDNATQLPLKQKVLL